MKQTSKLSHHPVTAWVTGALVISLSAYTASLLPVTFIMVMLILSVPNLFFGYYFAPAFRNYIFGLLTGISLYMFVEYLLYGPIYMFTGPVYAGACIFAIAAVLLSRLLYLRKTMENPAQRY